MRIKPGQHLSQEGVDLARRIGSEIGPFEIVITSQLHRAYETAIAMGFAVHDQLDALNMMSDQVMVDLGAWDVGFAAYGAAMQRGGAVTEYGESLAELWHMIASSISEGGSALLVTHGGIVEAGAVACLPEGDHAAWGDFVDYCEGVRLSFEDDKFIDVEILRVGSS
jgi:broad specificity phosphatase PhoE